MLRLRRLWPIHLHRLCRISRSTGIWHVRYHNRSLLMISGHQTPTILLRQLLTKVCILFVVVTVVFECLCSVKKNRFDICIKNPYLVFQWKNVRISNILQLKKATVALPILALTSAYVPPCVPMTLSRHVKWSTSSITFTPIVTETVLVEFASRILFFPHHTESIKQINTYGNTSISPPDVRSFYCRLSITSYHGSAMSVTMICRRRLYYKQQWMFWNFDNYSRKRTDMM